MLAYLRLMRPANIITAVADILLGYAVAGRVVSGLGQASLISIEHLPDLGWLVLSTIGLYGGGVVLNLEGVFAHWFLHIAGSISSRS